MEKKEPPGPSGLPVIGITHRFVRSPFQYREEVVEEYGDVVTMPGLNHTNYMLTHPEYVERVLVTDDDKFGKFPQDELTQLLGNGLLVNEGEQWKRQRQLMQPMFFRDRIATYSEMMVDYTERLREEWEPGETYDVETEMRRLTLQIISKSMFDRDPYEEQTEIADAFKQLATKFRPSRSKFPIPDWVPLPSNNKFEEGLDSLDDAVGDLITERRGDTEGRDDLLSLLLEAQSTADHEIDDGLLRDELVTMMLAGHDTTSLSITYTLYLLAEHPEHRERLYDELDAVLGDELPTFEDLDDLEFLERVLKESMRLYPVVHSISRKALTDVEVDGYEIPEGSRVFLAPWVTHRSERHWENATEFDPGRWTPERREERHDYAYFPFGAGPRQCIGKQFALVEAQLIIATLCQEYEFRLEPGYELDLVASITAQPEGGMPMQVVPREAERRVSAPAER